jgi:hypothetical protein
MTGEVRRKEEQNLDDIMEHNLPLATCCIVVTP